MTVTVRALPTAYDPPTGTLTVATPSCCCSSCCCCCLNTLALAAGTTASAAHQAATDNGRPAGLPAWLGFLAVPAAALVAWLVGRVQSSDDLSVPVVVGIAAGAVVAVIALRIAGARLRLALLSVVAIVAASLVLFFLELAVALGTSLWSLVLTPLSLWGGWRLGKTVMRDRAGSLP